MIKLAFNKAKPNLVFAIDEVLRVPLVGGIVEYYLGTLKDTSTVPDTEYPDYKVQVMGFESDWSEVPTDVGGTSQINNQSNKDVTPTRAKQTVKADKGYTGLTKVTVMPAPITESKTVHPSTGPNTIVPDEGDLGIARVDVQPMNLYEASITPTTDGVYIKTPKDYDAIRDVTVSPVTASIDANITASNIKKNVTILGVTGSYEGGSGGTTRIAPLLIRFGDMESMTVIDRDITSEALHSALDVSKLTSGYNFVSLCPSLTYIDFSNDTNTTNSFNAKYMFASSNNLVSVNVSNFTGTLSDASYMFAGDTKLEEVNMSNFKVTANTKLNGLFQRCNVMEKIDMRSMQLELITNSSNYDANTFNVPNDCLIIVRDNNAKNWVLTVNSNLTNVKTVAEYEAA